MSSDRLSVLVDGTALPADEAAAMWRKFSAYMEEHQGDFEGFARGEGFVHAAVAVRGHAPTLTLSTETPAAAQGERKGGKRRKRRRRGKRR